VTNGVVLVKRLTAAGGVTTATTMCDEIEIAVLAGAGREAEMRESG